MPDVLDIELSSLINNVKEIDYEKDGYQLLQRAAALAFNDLVETFANEGICKDKALIALVLVRLRDLQVRDYAMGFTNSENIHVLSEMWGWLLSITPAGYIAPVASLFSAINYEKGDEQLASRLLDQGLGDDSTYPLAKLLRRVYAAGWPAGSFATMRKELHPKVCASLFNE